MRFVINKHHMKSFDSFITEAVVSSKNLERAVSIFKKYFEKNMKTPLYRYGGDTGIVENIKGYGILFFYSKFKALRFNIIANHIDSITLWRSYKLGHTGDKTIELDGVNLVQAASLILKLLIKGAAVGEYPILPNPDLAEVKVLVEDAEYLIEAKRCSPADFVALVVPSLGHGETLDDVSYDLVVDIASQNNISFPTVFWSKRLKLARGAPVRFDLSSFAHIGKVGPGTDVHTLKVTTIDKNTASQTKGSEAKVAALTKAAKDAVDNPNVKEEMKDPNTLFGIMHNLVQLVCRGSRNSLVIYGGPGTGKTFTVTETIQSEGLVKNTDWFVLKGKISTSALYQTLFLHRKKSLLVFDDTDSVWGDADAANILKAALDSYDERTISWVTKQNVNVSRMTPDEREDFNNTLDAEIDANPSNTHKLPSEFVYQGKIVFISNLKYEKFDSAVLTRSAKIDMTLTDEQMFYRMEGILDKLGNPSVDLATKKEILGFIKQRNKDGLLEGPSMRTYCAAEDLYLSGLNNWQQLLEFV